jgi:hypothetical protein
VDADNVSLISEYPVTALPLLPFKERGKRFSMAEFERYNCSVPPGAKQSESVRTTCAMAPRP